MSVLLRIIAFAASALIALYFSLSGSGIIADHAKFMQIILVISLFWFFILSLSIARVLDELEDFKRHFGIKSIAEKDED